MTLQKKINNSIKLLKLSGKAYGELELGYSGGKDSDVILELAKMAGIKYKAIYRNTTIDPPGTIAHCREMDVTIIRPKKTFFELIRQRGFPSRFSRFCCDELKEYRINDAIILGIRREESIKRKKLYKEPTSCRIYKKKEHVEQIFPILDWTLDDIEEFVYLRKLKLHHIYYNQDGSLNLHRRVGCLGCPLAKDRGISEFKQYPLLVRAWLKAGEIWWNKPRKREIRAKYWATDIYELFALRTFYDKFENAPLNRWSLFPVDYKVLLEDFFKIKL